MKMEKQETAKTIAGHDVKRVHEKISDYLVRSEYDYICVINTQTGMLYVDTDELSSRYDIWLAWYWNAYYETGVLWEDGDDVPDIGYKYRIWQYTSTASVPGIAGGCDVNIAYGTR